MLRFLFQWLRADFYNPISQFVVKATAPLLRPLRRWIPGVGGIDMAAVILMLTLQGIDRNSGRLRLHRRRLPILDGRHRLPAQLRRTARRPRLDDRRHQIAIPRATGATDQTARRYLHPREDDEPTDGEVSCHGSASPHLRTERSARGGIDKRRRECRRASSIAGSIAFATGPILPAVVESAHPALPAKCPARMKHNGAT